MNEAAEILRILHGSVRTTFALYSNLSLHTVVHSFYNAGIKNERGCKDHEEFVRAVAFLCLPMICPKINHPLLSGRTRIAAIWGDLGVTDGSCPTLLANYFTICFIINIQFHNRQISF
ncbi:unnamed protein product [Cuscuta campestris]|uniref:Uncharacterized protein n=1 Tax=Cuscuta campestris TaxID=132261 RepID=A0A484MBL3_9ASTE|nr:unnamed protein product [Cuscuta campestris]